MALRERARARGSGLLVGLSVAINLVCGDSASAAAAAAAAASSKLPASKVTPQSCDDAELPPPPVIRVGEERIEPPISASFRIDSRDIHLRDVHEELQLTYVHNLVAPEEIDALVRLVTERNGWARSPLRSQLSGETLSKDERRNSSSCPMLWPLVYEGREDESSRWVIELGGSSHAAAAHVPCPILACAVRAVGERGAALLEELSLVTNLTKRVAELFTATGMELTPRYIEPLQLVRYQPSETFMPYGG